MLLIWYVLLRIHQYTGSSLYQAWNFILWIPSSCVFPRRRDNHTYTHSDTCYQPTSNNHVHQLMVVGPPSKLRPLILNVYCRVCLYRLFGLSVIVAYPFWSIYQIHPPTLVQIVFVGWCIYHLYFILRVFFTVGFSPSREVNCPCRL